MECKDVADGCSCNLSPSFIALTNAYRILQERYNKMRTENNRLVKALKLLPDQQLKTVLSQTKQLTTKDKKDDNSKNKKMDKTPVPTTRTSLNNTNNTTSRPGSSNTSSTTSTKSDISTNGIPHDNHGPSSTTSQFNMLCTVNDPVRYPSGVNSTSGDNPVSNDAAQDSGISDNYKDQCFASNSISSYDTGMLVEVKSLIDQSVSQGKALQTVRELLTHHTHLLRTIANTQQLFTNADARGLTSGDWTMLTPMN